MASDRSGRGWADLGAPWVPLEEVGMRDAFADYDKMLEEATSSGETPGLGYAVLRGGHLVRARCFGHMDQGQRPWTFDTICRMYSMTKTVAVVGLMCLVDDGLVSLEDPICKFLPAFARERLRVVHDEAAATVSPLDQMPVRALTVKDLLTHTSGLSYGAALGDTPDGAAEESYQPLIEKVDRGEITDLEQWVEELATKPLRFQPGLRWEYSYSVDVVGRIIEVVSGKKLDVFLTDRILRPLGMRDTSYSVPEEKRSRLAAFYRRRGDGKDGLVCVDSSEDSCFVEPRHQRILSAGGMLGSISGGLVSTLPDIVRLCAMLQRGGDLDGVRILRPETVALMSSNLLPGMTGGSESWCLETKGLGFGLLGSVAVPHAEANWYDVPGEIGWGGLAGTAWAVDHQEQLVVVSFSQVMYEFWIDEELRKAVRRSLGRPTEPAAAPEEAEPAKVDASGGPEEAAKEEPAPGGLAPPSPPRVAQSEEDLQLRLDLSAMDGGFQGTPSPRAASPPGSPMEDGESTPCQRAAFKRLALHQESSEKLSAEEAISPRAKRLRPSSPGVLERSPEPSKLQLGTPSPPATGGGNDARMCAAMVARAQAPCCKASDRDAAQRPRAVVPPVGGA